MSNVFEFKAVARSESGTSAAKLARRVNGVPAIIYGAGKEPAMLLLKHNEVIKHLAHEAVYSHVLDIKVDGASEKAILKAVQRHPSKGRIMHMDFQRVSQSEKLRVHVPLHFLNEAAAIGVKKGGIVTRNIVDVEVTCLPNDLPEFMEVDLVNLDVGESIHLTDIKFPAGVESTVLAQGEDHDLSVVSVAIKRGGGEEDDDEAVAEEVSDE